MYIKSINNVVGYKDLPDGFNVEFNENKTYIVGANFQRKTTVGSLFNWCLTGTSLNGKEKEQVANDTRRVSNVIVDITFVDNLGIEHRLIRDKGKEIHIKVLVDAENYRKKRAKTLEELALKIANTVVSKRKSFALEPMVAFERKVIHETLQNHPKVKTASTGDEPYRKVVISLK